MLTVPNTAVLTDCNHIVYDKKVLGEECIQKINSTLMSYYLDTSGPGHLPLYTLGNLTDVYPEILVSEKQAIGHRDPSIRDYYTSSDMRST